MKNAFVALALVLVLSTAFASKASNTKARLQKIASTPFGKTILETIQVELQSKDDPRPRIIELLDELKQQTIADQATADADFKASESRHEDVVSSQTSERDSNQDSLNTNLANQDAWSTKLDQDEKELDSANQLLSNLHAQSDAADAQRQANQEAWERADKKYASILDVLNQVREVINQRLNGRLQGEFLQTAHKQILGSFSQVKETVHSKAFKKLTPGFSKLVGFIAMKVEASLQDPEDDDAVAGLTSIVSLIENLHQGIEEERSHALDFNNQDIDTYNVNHDTLVASISTISSNVDNLENEIADLNGRLTGVAADIAAEQQRIIELNQSLVDEAAQWDDYDRKYAESTHDRNEQLSLIEEVEDIVKHQLSGLRDYAEGYIANH